MFAHIDDLKQQALGGFNPSGSVHQLIEDADRALKQADLILRTFRRPDLSYVEYLRAFEIVVEVIPRNKGWPDLQMDHRGGDLQKYQVLQNKINSLAQEYASIKETIVNNNLRNGVDPGQLRDKGHARTDSAASANGNDLNGAMGGIKIKPAPSPKPENLHGRAISTSVAASAAQDSLKDRLAALRNGTVPVDTSRPGSRASTNSSLNNSPVSTLTMPNSNDFGGRNSFETATPINSGPTSRPQGPRPLPAPPVPGKLPLDTDFAAAMPQAPKATYSPARNMQVTGNIEPPRHTARSLVSTSSRKASITSSASSHAPNGSQPSDGGEYFPAFKPPTANGAPPSQVIRRKSVHMPKETRYSVERLYDYLDRYNILLIDFRPRQDFDQGHIFARNVMCVDPIHVIYGMSADQLLERMVISPEIEQEMFMNRNKYDLVIYYDNDTQSETYLTRPIGELQTKLKYLHEALLDFNYEKPLQYPPILLIGGIEAWTDLVGKQALITSDTANRVKQGRAIQRRPLRDGAPLRPPKRRLQDYNPLDAEETQNWKERARAESVVIQTPAPLFDDSGQAIQEEPEGELDELDSAAIQEFNERFPEAGSLDRYAFNAQKPTRAPPEPPPKVPMYPTAPPSSSHPTAPARPQPAAPRMSYTGVSDRAASQNAPLVRSTSLTPYVPARWLSVTLPKTGLYNFRFTCYMNTLLQALSGTVPLSLHFIEEQFMGNIQTETTKGGSKGIMPSIYMNLIKSLWKGDVNWIKPTTFRKFCSRLNSQWGNDSEEQDAKEFYDFLIDVLHEDLNVRWMHRPLPDLNPQEEQKRERMPKTVVARLEWQRFLHRNQSAILSLFGGQYSSRLSFPACGHTSTTHDFLFSISVEIPNMRNPTLDDCMRSYCKKERLGREESATCGICNEKRETDKQLTITRAPQFLVVHFKRFQTARGGARKIGNPVDFPLENFDLEPYMLPQPSPEEANHIAQSYRQVVARPDQAMLPPYKYDAYAVVRHIGDSIKHGHYTCLVKDPARKVWRTFNDQIHDDFHPGDGRYSGGNAVTNGQAYIVFYQRNMPAHASANAPIGPGGVGKI